MRTKLITFSMVLAAIALVGCSTADDVGSYDNFGYAAEFDGNANGYEPSVSGDKFEEFADNPFVAVAEQPVSTFSVDADGASYAIVRAYLRHHYTVEPSMVRIEEFLNYFTFNYAAPTGDHTVAINAEVGECPWNADHRLLRLGIKGKELLKNETPRANFVFLIDVSGSMYDDSKLPLLKTGLMNLVSQMNPDDRISIVTYSGKVSKLLESTPVSEAKTIMDAIAKLSASGATAGGEALKMAYEEALSCYDAKANNRIIMGTDGDFNVGVTSTQALVEMVESYAARGIYMTCLGFGLGNLNDAMMEKISNAGNGSYYYIDSEAELMKVFVAERERFVSVANDAKCQVTFDADVVSQYRLIGYENRVMQAEDFNDDSKDAGEIGAGQTITALYELVLTDDAGSNVADADLMTFDFRYKKSLQASSVPLQKTLHVSDMTATNTPSDDFYFAAGVAAYGMLLRQSPYKGDASPAMARQLVGRGLSFDPHGYRAELLELMNSDER